MPQALSVKPLDRREVEQAFPLVEALHPEITLATWRQFAARHIPAADEAEPGPDGGRPDGMRPQAGEARSDAAHKAAPEAATSGILAVKFGTRIIHGLAAFQVRDTLGHGRTLVVEEFVALALLDTESVAERLLDSLERLAVAHGCDAIHIQIPRGRFGRSRGGEDGFALQGLRVFERAGHQLDAVTYCKRITPLGHNTVSLPFAPRQSGPAE